MQYLLKPKPKVGNPKHGVVPRKYWTHTVTDYNGRLVNRLPIQPVGTVGKMFYWPDNEWWDAVMIKDCGSYGEADDVYIAVCPPNIMDWEFWWEDFWTFWPLDIWEKEHPNG